MNEYIIGVDIGTYKICASAGKIDKNQKFQVIAVSEFKYLETKKNISLDIYDVSDEIKKCIEKLEDMIGANVNEVYVSISGEYSKLIYNKAKIIISSENNEISKGDVDRIVKTIKSITLSSEREAIGIIAKQYMIDGYDNIKNPIGMFGNMLEMEAQIVTVQTTVINNLYKCINKIGLKVKEFVYLPEAVARLVLKTYELNAGTAVVDTGKNSINISIYKCGTILTNYTIPIGANAITKDLSICLKIPLEQAEMLKKEYSDLEIQNIENDAKIEAKSGSDPCITFNKKLFNEIIEARTDEIIRIIEKSIIDSGHYEDISYIVLLGGGICLLNGIENYSKIKFRKTVRIGYANCDNNYNTSFIGCIGIANYIYNNMKLNYLNDDENNCNLLQDNELKNKKREGNIITKIKGFFTDFF